MAPRSRASAWCSCPWPSEVKLKLDENIGLRGLELLQAAGHDVTRFPPEQGAGVIILEAGSRTTESAILDRLHDFLAVLRTQPVAGSLWIGEPGRVRIHLRNQDE
jgi:hypothetical protein